MKAPAPTISTAATGRSGEIAIGIGSLHDTVGIYYAVDGLTTVGNWIEGPKFTGPGFFSIQGLNDYEWYSFMAVLEHNRQPISPASNISKVLPLPQIPYYSVELYTQQQVTLVEGRTFSFRVRIEARLPHNMPQEIFLYRRESFSPTEVVSRDVFTAVCKIGDLQRYPAGSPDAGSPYFRLNYVDFMERDQDGPALLFDAIHDDVDELVKALEDYAKYLQPVNPVPPVVSSSSSSVSLVSSSKSVASGSSASTVPASSSSGSSV